MQGEDMTKLASMAKLKVGRLAREVADSCLQFWGGMGFTNEVLVSRFYRSVHYQIVLHDFKSVQKLVLHTCFLIT